jgi:methyl-accepting chemotaxis protein
MSEKTFTPAAEPQDPAHTEDSQTPSSIPAPAPENLAPHHDAHQAPTPAPAPAAAPAPEKPLHMGMSVDQRAYQQYQSLAQVVLDSADLATKSAEAAANASSTLRQTTADFKDLTESGHKKARLLLVITGGVLIISLIFFLIMGVRLVSRINQLDAMLMAVGKRVVELNSGMESLEGVNQSVKELTSQQLALTKSQGQIEGRIDASLKQSESLVQKVPSETAKQVAASSDSVIRQVQGINAKLQTQANAVQAMGNEVKSLKTAVGNVDGLKRDVEALVTLQKERYLETVQKNTATASRERAVQFPRYAAPKPGETSSASPAPATSATNPASAALPPTKP